MSRKSVLPHYFHNTNEHRSLRFTLFSPAIHHHYEAFKVKTLSRCGFSKLIHLFRSRTKNDWRPLRESRITQLMDGLKNSNPIQHFSVMIKFFFFLNWHKISILKMTFSSTRCVVVSTENWFISPQKILKATLESNSDWSLGGDSESRRTRTSISWEESKKKTQLNDEAQVTVVDFLCLSAENFLLVINAFERL